MSTSEATTYDEIPYTNHAFHSTHPGNLAMIGHLHGMSPPDVTTCRVLELGCGRGGNLLPMAEQLPGASFLGIDLSQRQVEEGKEAARELGLKNARLEQMSILDVDESLGTFDYILCHGVYSWVPEQVQQKIFEVCARTLSPAGIAYISHNTYPGWHYRGVARDMLRFHVSHDAPPSVQLHQARDLLSFTLNAVADREGLRSKLLREEVQHLSEQADSYLFHEQLESYNSPSHVHEFLEKARDAGLQYVGEAKVEPLVQALLPGVLDAIRKLTGDRIRQEQYIDFLVHRTFRRTLLCRGDVSVQPEPSAERVRSYHFTGMATPETPEAGGGPAGEVKFVNPTGVSMTTAHPLVKTALTILHNHYPLAVPFARLAEETAAALGQVDVTRLEGELAPALLACYLRDMVEMELYPASFYPQVSERPCGSPAARLQARGDSRVTSRRHRGFGLDDIDRLLLSHMDGTRSHDQLVDLLVGRVTSGEIDIQDSQGSPLPAEQVREFCQESFRNRSRHLAVHAFLIG